MFIPLIKMSYLAFGVDFTSNWLKTYFLDKKL